jgi:hypothetical protein
MPSSGLMTTKPAAAVCLDRSLLCLLILKFLSAGKSGAHSAMASAFLIKTLGVKVEFTDSAQMIVK